jgi:hypothetical protein
MQMDRPRCTELFSRRTIPDLRWPGFPPYQAEVKDFYDKQLDEALNKGYPYPTA